MINEILLWLVFFFSLKELKAIKLLNIPKRTKINLQLNFFSKNYILNLSYVLRRLFFNTILYPVISIVGS